MPNGAGLALQLYERMDDGAAKKAMANLFDDDSDEGEAEGPAELTSAEQAEAAVKDWRKLKVPKEFRHRSD